MLYILIVNVFHVQKLYRRKKDVQAAQVKIREQFYGTYWKRSKKVDRWLYQILIFPVTIVLFTFVTVFCIIIGIFLLRCYE